MSTAEAEYISAARCCTQLLWMKHQLEDYQINANSIPISWKIIRLMLTVSEIFHQGGILKAVKMLKTVTDKQLGTITGKVINARTLRKMQLTKEVIKLETNL